MFNKQVFQYKRKHYSLNLLVSMRESTYSCLYFKIVWCPGRFMFKEVNSILDVYAGSELKSKLSSSRLDAKQSNPCSLFHSSLSHLSSDSSSSLRHQYLLAAEFSSAHSQYESAWGGIRWAGHVGGVFRFLGHLDLEGKGLAGSLPRLWSSLHKWSTFPSFSNSGSLFFSSLLIFMFTPLFMEVPDW